MNNANNIKVAIFQHRLLHYRVELFERLKEACQSHGIDIHLIHGQPSPTEKTRNDTCSLPWSTAITNSFLHIKGVDLIWQASPEYIDDMDLIIIMQENRILSNYPLIVKSKFSKKKIAYWGHGANFQSKTPSGLREKWKKIWLNNVDWWFSYTDITTELLTQGGYPQKQITTLNNAVNTKDFKDLVDSFSESEIREIRKSYGIEDNDKVAVFCGSLYPDKKIGLMLAACEIIKQHVPNFHLLVIGSGPSSNEVEQTAKAQPWIHSLGVQKGKDKAAFFRMSKIMLNPGLLGLHILDAFSIGIPLVSTKHSLHSPEIAYITNDINGVLVEKDTPIEYAQAVIQLLDDEVYYKRISDSAFQASHKYTLDNMVNNFCDGIVKCLNP